MKSYHVYATAKPGVAALDFEASIKEFLDGQISENHLHGYHIIRFDSKAAHGEMPEYQMICDYASEDDLKNGFQAMRPDRWKQEPHSSMMEMVGSFRVAFSSDVSRSSSL